MFQNIPLPAAHEVSDSSSGVTPCIVMKSGVVLYHEVSSFSAEHWTKVKLQECVVVGSVYHLPWRYSLVEYYAINVIRHTKHHLHSLLCRAHFFGGGEPACFRSFDWRFMFGSYERAQVSYIATILTRKSSHSLWYRSNKASATA